MKGMTLVKKSTCAFAVLILFFVSFGIYAVYSGTKISQSANIIKEWSDNFGTVSQLSDSLNGMRLKASMLFITEDPAKQAQLLSELKEAQADVEKSINAAEDWGNTHEFSNPEGKEKVLASVKDLKDNWAAYQDASKKTLALYNQGKRAEAEDSFENVARPAFLKMQDIVV